MSPSACGLSMMLMDTARVRTCLLAQNWDVGGRADVGMDENRSPGRTTKKAIATGIATSAIAHTNKQQTKPRNLTNATITITAITTTTKASNETTTATSNGY